MCDPNMPSSRDFLQIQQLCKPVAIYFNHFTSSWEVLGNVRHVQWCQMFQAAHWQLGPLMEGMPSLVNRANSFVRMAVTGIGFRFYGADAYDQPIGNWKSAAETNMESIQIVRRDMSGVANMKFIFSAVDFINHQIGSWDTSVVTSWGLGSSNGVNSRHRELLDPRARCIRPE